MKTFIIFVFISLNIFSQQQIDITWPTLADSPWPMIKRNPQLTGRSPYKGPQTATVIWTVDFPHGIFSGPVIGEDHNLYFGPYYADLYIHSGISAYFYCYDRNGNLLWEYNLPDKRPPQSGALIDSVGCIYFGSLDHYFYALNPDGTLKWRYPTGDLIGESAIPNIDLKGNLYVSSQDGYLYSLTRDGQLNWKVNHHNFANQNTAISPDGNTIYITGIDSNLYALNTDGSIKWIFGCSKIWHAPMVDSEGNIYFTPEGIPQYLYSLLPNGNIRWKFYVQNGGNLPIHSIPVIDYQGNISFIAIDTVCCPTYKELISVDYQGNFRWRYLLNDDDYDDFWQPLICDNEGTIYFGSTFGNNYYAIANDGKLKWKLPLHFPDKQVDHTGAISEDGTLYIGVHDNALVTGCTKTLYAIKDTGLVGVLDNEELLTDYSVEQNFPNPFNPSTTINYQLPKPGFVTLKVYDVLGKEVSTLVNEQKNQGRYSVNFSAIGGSVSGRNASRLASGVYIYQIRVNDYVDSKKMLLLN